MCFFKNKKTKNPKSNDEYIANHDQKVTYSDNNEDNTAECEVYSDNDDN